MEAARDLIFDVGMHRGEDTAYYLRKGYRVVGFEANPQLAAECRVRFAAQIDEGRVTVVEGAIAPPGPSTIDFYVHKRLSIWGTTDVEWVRRNHGDVERVEVSAVDFGAYLADVVPWYLKIDIEGADTFCLDALADQRARPAFVSIEAEKVSFEALRSQITGLQRLGYDRFAAVQQDQMWRRDVQATDLHGHRFWHRFEEAASGPFGEDLREPWLSAAQILARYRRIFRRYRFLGDDATINHSALGVVVRKRLADLLRTPLPGWYDTHATRSTARDRVSTAAAAP